MPKTSSTLIALVLSLLAIGIVIVASTSSVRGEASFGDPQYFLKRQLLWLLIALLGGLLVVRFDYHWWQKLALPMAVGALLLLALVFVPGLGPTIGGSRRWIRVGPLGLQPSEIAKFSVVVVLSAWMSVVGRRAGRFREGVLLPCLWLGVVLGLMMLEPDFGTTVLTGAVALAILFAGGTRLSYLVSIGMLGLCGFALAVMHNSHRLGRVLAFVMPEKYPATAYHLAQSKYAFIGGGWLGVGLGNSMQKHFYLPEAHTDFIFAIIGEELGFVATAGIVAVLFLGILVCGIIITWRAPDHLGRLLAFGFTTMLALQAVINIGVVTGCLPTKGLSLPFISYGGSSLLVSVAAVCVLLNIARHVGDAAADEHVRIIRDRRHRL